VKPDLVLSFGAGGCSLAFETRARNFDDTSIADNAGVTRRRKPIIPGGKEFIAFNAPMVALFENSPVYPRFVKQLSTDAGAYVCNNLAYWLSNQYAYTGSTTRFGFIHVPPVECGSAAEPEALAQTIYEGLRRNVPDVAIDCARTVSNE
jgi:pyroglutamyl-peptidase